MRVAVEVELEELELAQQGVCARARVVEGEVRELREIRELEGRGASARHAGRVRAGYTLGWNLGK